MVHENFDTRVQFRCTKQEKADYAALAARYGFSLSELFRFLVLKEKREAQARDTFKTEIGK